MLQVVGRRAVGVRRLHHTHLKANTHMTHASCWIQISRMWGCNGDNCRHQHTHLHHTMLLLWLTVVLDCRSGGSPASRSFSRAAARAAMRSPSSRHTPPLVPPAHGQAQQGTTGALVVVGSGELISLYEIIMQQWAWFIYMFGYVRTMPCITTSYTPGTKYTSLSASPSMLQHLQSMRCSIV